MNATELRAKSAADLNTQLIELRREQFNLRMQMASGQLNTVHQIKQVRHDIARIKTVLTEQHQGEAA